MADVTYSKFLGYYNKDNFPPKTPKGTILLSEAENVDINDALKPIRRDGYISELSASHRSIWANDSIILAVKSGNLMRIIPDNSLTTFTETIIKSSVGDYDMDYTEAEYGKYVYFTNSAVIGYVKDFTAYNLPAATYTYKMALPAGHIIDYYMGRNYVAVGNKVVYTDGVNLNHYDIREDLSYFKFTDRITMWKSVADGVWVSDGKTIMFFSGLSPLKMTSRVVAGYGAIEGTAKKEKGIIIAGTFYDNAVIFKARDGHGICVGGNSGQFVNLTEDRIITDDAEMGTGIVVRGEIDKYIAITR